MRPRPLLLLVPVLWVSLVLWPGRSWAEPPYVPAPPEQVPGYSAELLKGRELDGKSLRELSILRNTVYARYGWDGYRKPWLREYFHAQPWFKPNPKFSYRLLSQVDRKNVHKIGTFEQAFTQDQLQGMQDQIYDRHKTGPGRKPEKPADDQLTAEERIELGLISRALGGFALDDRARAQKEASLDQLLSVTDLRQLSLRDLRLLRNTIYARRGRPFKSQVLQAHFGGMAWYKINPGYTDALLTPTDVRNVTLIKSVENEFGGPLKDEDWLIEPAIDQA